MELVAAEVDRAALAMSRPPLTLGTAGHIDHGKTALIGRAHRRRHRPPARGAAPRHLDRARLRAADAALRPPAVGVDVPGHERFVRTMVAGATGIDLYLMAIAADDGVMPQTREHAAVLRALGVDSGVVAITKTDLADPAAGRDARPRELLPGARDRPGLRPHRRRARRAAGGARRGVAGAARAGPPSRRRAAAARRPRVHDPRRGHRRHGNAVVGLDRPRRSRSRCCRAAAGCGSAGSRSTMSPSTRARPVSGSRST